MKIGKSIAVLVSVMLIAFCFIGCASLEKPEDSTVPISAEESYSLVGYDYLFQLNGNTIQFKFLDIFSKEEIQEMADNLMTVIPDAEGYTYPRSGNITFTSSDILTAEDFNAFVENAKAFIYDMIY